MSLSTVEEKLGMVLGEDWKSSILRPCPFCRTHRSPIIRWYASDSVDGGFFADYVECLACGACGPSGFGIDGAVVKWNERVGD